MDDLLKQLMAAHGSSRLFSIPSPNYAASLASKYKDSATLDALGHSTGDRSLLTAADLLKSGFDTSVEIPQQEQVRPGLVDSLRQQALDEKRKRNLMQMQNDFRNAGFDATIE